MYLKKCKLISLGILLFAVVSILFTSCRNPAGPEFSEIFVVTFYLNGGQIQGRPKTSPQFAKYRESLTPVPNPIRPGFRFLGWFIYPYGEKWCFCDDVVTGDKTLYARWELQILMGGGGDYSGPGLTEIIVPGKSVLNQLRWLHDQDIDGNDHVQGGPGRVYILRAHSQADLLAWGYAGGLEPVIPGNYLGINFGIDFPGRDYVYVRLIRYGGGPLDPRELRLGSLGTMLRIAPTNTLAIYDVDIVGWQGPVPVNNPNPAIVVNGTLRLTRAAIRNNQGSGGFIQDYFGPNQHLFGTLGSGVMVMHGGRFYMMANSHVRANGGRGVVVRGGTFFMDTGAVVGGDYVPGPGWVGGNRGGVYLREGSFATMMPGSYIRGNISTQTAVQGGHGGGVRMDTSTFHMRGGAVITGNSVSHTAPQGGGVYIRGNVNAGEVPFAYFRMYPGAVISNNQTAGGAGGGVFIRHFHSAASNIGPSIYPVPPSYPGTLFYPVVNTFNMLGGSITGNETGGTGGGGGVSTNYPGTHFIMHSGTISNNTAGGSGGGVHMGTGSVFIMHSGTISNNTAVSAGGGITMTNLLPGAQTGIGRRTRFYMHSGTISDNVAATSGGGANVSQNSFFYMNNNVSIVNNISGLHGGGLNVYGADARLTMRNTAFIQGNRAGLGTGHHGGGVRVAGSGGRLTMYNTTTIQGNIAGGNGGGVAVTHILAPDTPIFIMNGSPSILNNTAGVQAIDGAGNITYHTPPPAITTGFGGGVHIAGNFSEFHMNGGLIAGNSAHSGGGVFAAGTNANPALINISGGSIRGGSSFASTAPFNTARVLAGAQLNSHAMFRTSTRAATIFGILHPPATQTVFPDDLP